MNLVKLFFSAIFIIAFSLLLILGCSHTNELGKYDIRGKTAKFDTSVEPIARTIKITRGGSTTSDSKDKDKKKNVLETIAELGTEIFSASKESDIKDWVDTYEIVDHISSGLQEALESYVDIKPVDGDRQKPDFMVEMNLTNCELKINESSVYLHLRCTSKMIERVTGNIVWENYENVDEQLSYDYVSGKKKKNSTESNVLTALKLASLSEREIDLAINDASEEAGRKMAETFREDLAEARK
ncbi:MAG: hypothetical protein KKA84_06515 [Bacteroidetes bacterium]|nr:hypothetical protein [Bacteroidota bacterium]